MHSIGPMEIIMGTIHITNKGRMIDTLQTFYILREMKLNNQINEKLTIKPNITFEAIIYKDIHRGLPTP